jgi:transcription initiation factor IIE alpha subunit
MAEFVCATCGEMIELLGDRRAPECCGEPMHELDAEPESFQALRAEVDRLMPTALKSRHYQQRYRTALRALRQAEARFV